MIEMEFKTQVSAYGGFPKGSAGKESTCNAGDLDLIPGSGRSPGEGIGCLLQYSWASLVVQTVRNPPAIWVTWVQSLVRDPTFCKQDVAQPNK